MFSKFVVVKLIKIKASVALEKLVKTAPFYEWKFYFETIHCHISRNKKYSYDVILNRPYSGKCFGGWLGYT